MLNLSQIESALVDAMKSRNQLMVDTLRSLKTRVQNELIAKGGELSEDDILALVSSEVKKRKEAAESFANAGRDEASAKEKAEQEILSEFLPEQASSEVIEAKIEELVSQNSWTKSDFGKAMGELKAHFGNTADGGEISKLLKAKLG